MKPLGTRQLSVLLVGTLLFCRVGKVANPAATKERPGNPEGWQGWIIA
jgi:hypothetical protein